MKTLLTTLAIWTIILLSTNSSQAQFFKNIVNNVKQTVENRANDKSIKTTNKGLDKADSATHSNGSSNSKNSSQASNDAVLKFLGKLTGGGGVSAADSAAAIKAFMNSEGGSGVHYLYTTTGSGKTKQLVKNYMNTYYANSGYGRSEINLAGMIAASEGVKAGSPLVVIGNVAQPKYSVILDAESKQYSLNVIDTSLINAGGQTFKVTKIGIESVGGYSCTHAKLTTTSGFKLFKSTTTMDTWTSPDVPGYSRLKKWMTVQNEKPGMMQALAKAGCEGFLVKMASQSKDYTYSMELTKAENGRFPDSMFKIPAGYTKSDSNLMMSNMMKAGMQASKNNKH